MKAAFIISAAIAVVAATPLENGFEIYNCLRQIERMDKDYCIDVKHVAMQCLDAFVRRSYPDQHCGRFDFDDYDKDYDRDDEIFVHDCRKLYRDERRGCVDGFRKKHCHHRHGDDRRRCEDRYNEGRFRDYDERRCDYPDQDEDRGWCRNCFHEDYDRRCDGRKDGREGKFCERRFGRDWYDYDWNRHDGRDRHRDRDDGPCHEPDGFNDRRECRKLYLHDYERRCIDPHNDDDRRFCFERFGDRDEDRGLCRDPHNDHDRDFCSWRYKFERKRLCEHKHGREREECEDHHRFGDRGKYD